MYGLISEGTDEPHQPILSPPMVSAGQASRQSRKSHERRGKSDIRVTSSC